MRINSFAFKRSMMERLFNDTNEPFWRSAKHVELGVLPEPFLAEWIIRLGV